MPHGQHHRRAKPKLPPSGPPMPPRHERVIPILRRSVPSADTMAEMIELAPDFLRGWLLTEVPREIRAEASGIQTTRRTITTSFLERSSEKDDERESD